MEDPRHPEDALLDFQRETAPLAYPAELIDEDMHASEQVRALALAAQQVYERAERALEGVARPEVLR